MSTAIAEKKYIEASQQRSQFESDYDEAISKEVESPIQQQQPQQVQEYAEPSPKAQEWALKTLGSIKTELLQL